MMRFGGSANFVTSGTIDGVRQTIYLDTNVLIKLGEGTDEISNLLYSLIDSQTMDESPFLCTSELSLAELLVRPYREKNETLIQLYDNLIQRQNPWLEVGPVDHQTLWYAAVLRAGYPSIKLPDAIHLTTAIGFSCSHFLTADARIRGPNSGSGRTPA